MSNSTVASNKRTAEAAALNNDEPLDEYDATPVIPINLISLLILPFLQDRLTWNAVCSANKELHAAGVRMTPPWPATKLRMGLNVATLKFSPCGSFLAYGTRSSPYLVHICDRRGRQTCLRGHTSGISFLSFSNDGNYLASSERGRYNDEPVVRIWPTDSTTRLPQQSDKTLPGSRLDINCLDFSPSDSNILVTGHHCVINIWDVEQEARIYSFDHDCGYLQSLYFPVQDEGRKCSFVSATGSLIRTWWNDLSGFESDIIDMPGLGQVGTSVFSHCGSLLAAVSRGSGRMVTLYNMRTMSVVRRLTIPRFLHYGGLAFSPDGKTLVLGFTRDEIQIREVPDLNLLRRLLQPDASAYPSTGAVAFDPSGQFLASAAADHSVRLWTL
jgi:WD40 repeat protein